MISPAYFTNIAGRLGQSYEIADQLLKYIEGSVEENIITSRQGSKFQADLAEYRKAFDKIKFSEAELKGMEEVLQEVQTDTERKLNELTKK